MQETSDLYKDLLASDHWAETRLAIGETGTLITKQGESITFGGVSILIAASGADGGYDESLIMSMETDIRVFEEDTPTAGDCVTGQINVEMIRPAAEIPKQARMVPYVRLTDGIRNSEWIQKGVFYIDTRRKKEDGSPIEKIVIQGYDDMLKAEQDYPSSKLSWPAKDIDVVREIASFMGVKPDSRTVSLMKKGYKVPHPLDYSCRETLGYIASMYAGCFIMSDMGELRLVCLNGIPAESRYLVSDDGYAVTFGGVRILV